ncbi:MAG: Flp family type IVb pilin [Brevundimonas sp.]|uniref:Flp family type IVb pilin n=1 Tax=Brevundimonas sp. TaxID=1871086 RepID=UPI000DBBDC92|nr:Flp family type IVb pilin [Brevundimonas sp.]PZU60856.1 MAG: Flp family type IVb pilin [Brevundimonas sp.]
MTKFVSRFVKDESGATAIEYGLIAALMAVAIITCLTAFGPQMKEAFGGIGTSMTGTDDITNG